MQFINADSSVFPDTPTVLLHNLNRN